MTLSRARLAKESSELRARFLLQSTASLKDAPDDIGLRRKKQAVKDRLNHMVR